MSFPPEKEPQIPTTPTPTMTIEPKKSARLAQKRKLREEAGTPISEDDSPNLQFNYGKSSSSSKTITSSTSSSETGKRSGPVKISTTSTPIPSKSYPVRFPSRSLPISKPNSSWKPASSPLSNFTSLPPRKLLPMSTVINAEDIKDRDLKIRLTSHLPSTSSQDIISLHSGVDGKGDELTGLTIPGLIKQNDKKDQPESNTMIDESIPRRNKNPSDSKIIFLTRADGNYITFPTGMELPIRKTVCAPPTPAFVKCFVEGCPNRKKYSCSKTKIPLCSLACYRLNLEKTTSVLRLGFMESLCT